MINKLEKEMKMIIDFIMALKDTRIDLFEII